ncbi:MAG TPA: hypothetical protein VHZ07_15525 [Bryobacteraceae bacterium]|jgi:hypothetical protein|nr:hypothetical protein [Bryobacteraceae bacterium]
MGSLTVPALGQPILKILFPPYSEIGFDFSTADLFAFYDAAERCKHVGQGTYYSQKKQKAA